MSSGHFIKHLSCALCSRLSTLPHRLIRPPSSSPRLTALSTLSSPNRYGISRCRTLSILATISTSSAPHAVPPPPDAYAAEPYLSVNIRCPRDVVDALSEALLSFGACSTSVDIEDAEKSSDEICINSIYAECDDVEDCILRAAKSIGLKETPDYEVKKGDQSEWILQAQESFCPVEVVKGFWIVPEWIAPPDPQAINIILNPGLAFGTGEHPTTKLCISLLHSLIKGGELFLDYGTGSGVLAIAALKFGAALSVGTDIDPQAIKSARCNAALNNVEDEKFPLHLVPSEDIIHEMDEKRSEDQDQSAQGTCIIPDKEKYDVVIANILLNPLLDLADHIVAYAKPGAVVGVSGILSEQLPYIMDRYSQLLEEDISVSEMDGWVCLSGTKKRSQVTTSTLKARDEMYNQVFIAKL